MEPELFVYQETKIGNEVQSVKKYSSVGFYIPEGDTVSQVIDE